MFQCSLTRVPRICNGKMIVSSTNDIDKMGYHRVNGCQKLGKERKGEMVNYCLMGMSLKLCKINKCWKYLVKHCTNS